MTGFHEYQVVYNFYMLMSVGSNYEILTKSF
jgi:hypothetical protein